MVSSGKMEERELFIAFLCLKNRQMDSEFDSDHEIVMRCKRGDISAFEQIVRKYEKKMFNISFRMIGDYNEAAEAVQDAFVSAYRNMKGFKGDSKFSTWLYSIVANFSRNRVKKARSQSFREPLSLDDPVDIDDRSFTREHPSGELSVLERLEKRDVALTVQGCINGLEDNFREVIVLRDIQGFSYEEITAMLHISEGTLKSRLHRGRSALKNCLKKYLGDL
jgi:RNA polymerase sigma-70 factor (ECF subfamily)